MTNYRSDKKDERDQDICVETISVASKNYKVKPLIEGEKRRGGHPVGWREQVSLHYLISPNTLKLPDDLISHCSMTNNDPKNDQNYDSAITDFACLEHAFESFMVRFCERKACHTCC